MLAHYQVYEFHPVVAKLQVFCSEDLGAFYLDVLKDRLYTTAPKSLARRSAQTALWQITQAMLRWMAPFLSFTAESLEGVRAGRSASIFTETYWKFDAPDEALLAKWARIRDPRCGANKGDRGGAHQRPGRLLAAGQPGHRAGAALAWPENLSVAVHAVHRPKCERCWHWRDDVDRDPRTGPVPALHRQPVRRRRGSGASPERRSDRTASQLGLDAATSASGADEQQLLPRMLV